MSEFQWILDSLENFCQSGCKIARVGWPKEEISKIRENGYDIEGSAADGWLIVTLDENRKG